MDFNASVCLVRFKGICEGGRLKRAMHRRVQCPVTGYCVCERAALVCERAALLSTVQLASVAAAADV